MIDNSTKKRYNKCRVKNAECRVEMIFCRDRRPRRSAKTNAYRKQRQAACRLSLDRQP